MDKISELSQYEKTIPLILILGRNNRINQSQIAEIFNLRSQQGIKSSLRSLEKLGLVAIERNGSNTNWVSLTQKGKNVAELVEELTALLNE